MKSPPVSTRFFLLLLLFALAIATVHNTLQEHVFTETLLWLAPTLCITVPAIIYTWRNPVPPRKQYADERTRTALEFPLRVVLVIVAAPLVVSYVVLALLSDAPFLVLLPLAIVGSFLGFVYLTARRSN